MNFRKKTEEIEKAIDVSKYLKLLRISVQVTRYINHFEMKQLFWRVYFVYYHFVSEPKVFDDMQKLSEVDRLSTQLYESSPYSFHLHKNNYAQRNATKYACGICFMSNLGGNLQFTHFY